MTLYLDISSSLTKTEDMRALNDIMFQENKKHLTDKTLLAEKLAAAGAHILFVTHPIHAMTVQHTLSVQ